MTKEHPHDCQGQNLARQRGLPLLRYGHRFQFEVSVAYVVSIILFYWPVMARGRPKDIVVCRRSLAPGRL